MGREEFKEFVKKNPTLIKYVRNGEMTWQKYYELYDLYGEDSEIWKDYKEEIKNVNSLSNIKGLTLSEVVNWFKNIKIDDLQEGIGNVQRVLGVVQDFSKKNSIDKTKPEYKPRPLYKHFED